MNRTARTTTNGQRRRLRWQQQALTHAYLWLLDDPALPFEAALQRIRQRWPVSCRGTDFASRLAWLYGLPPEEREETLFGRDGVLLHGGDLSSIPIADARIAQDERAEARP